MVRLKHRYLLVNILYPDSTTASNASEAKKNDDLPYTVQFRQPTSDRLDAKLFTRMIRDGVAELFGDYGSGMVAGSFQIKYFSNATSTAIVRVSRDHYRLVWAVLTCTTHLPKPVNQPCVMQVVRVSGTIKKAEEEAIRRARLGIKRAQRSTARLSSLVGEDDTTQLVRHVVGQDIAIDDEDDLGFADGIEDVDVAEGETESDS